MTTWEKLIQQLMREASYDAYVTINPIGDSISNYPKQ